MIPLQDFVDIEDQQTPNSTRRTASARNVRMVEQVYPQRSPDPPRQGDIPARPARMPVFVSQSQAEIHAVMEDEFQFVMYGPVHYVQQLPGVQAPFQERSNVQKPAAVAYGSLFELTPSDRYPQTIR